MVWRYRYVESLTKHGGVKVTFKDRLSRQSTEAEDEYGPVEEKWVYPTTGEAYKKNVETEDGVIFIPFPPDLRTVRPTIGCR